MRALRVAAVLSVAIAGLLPAQASSRLRPGEWVGPLNVGAVTLRLGFSVRAREGGGFDADLDSYDQGTMDIPADSVRLSGDTVRIFANRIGASYHGVLDAEGRNLTGIWRQGMGTLPLKLTLADGAMLASLARRRPQEPKAPFPYRAEEVAFESAPGVRLSGTLTIPSGSGPHPAVVLVSGSGPQDRDETLLGHKPFLVLADHLTRRGIAVLRYDDRGTNKSTGNFPTSTSADFAADARAAVVTLRGRTDIRKDAIGIVGHSEGGLIAPLVARDPSSGVSFIVLLAGPGTRGDEILLAQADLIGKASGIADSVRARSNALSKRMYEVLRQASDTVGLAARLRQMFADYGATLSPAQRQQMGFSDAAIDAQVSQLVTPWFRFFLSYDPRESLRQVRVPVLALNGTLDLQVPHKENLLAIGEALRAGGNRDHTEIELPGLNHLFQTAKSGAPAEYVTIEETFAPAALARVSEWIATRFRPAVP